VLSIGKLHYRDAEVSGSFDEQRLPMHAAQGIGDLQGAMLDPEAVDARAKADQAAIIERHGGREAVLARGSFGATPPPGEKAELG
jgi:hypothetical protein